MYMYESICYIYMFIHLYMLVLCMYVCKSMFVALPRSPVTLSMKFHASV